MRWWIMRMISTPRKVVSRVRVEWEKGKGYPTRRQRGKLTYDSVLSQRGACVCRGLTGIRSRIQSDTELVSVSRRLVYWQPSRKASLTVRWRALLLGEFTGERNDRIIKVSSALISCWMKVEWCMQWRMMFQRERAPSSSYSSYFFIILFSHYTMLFSSCVRITLYNRRNFVFPLWPSLTHTTHSQTSEHRLDHLFMFTTAWWYHALTVIDIASLLCQMYHYSSPRID
jgi:hypothetical protein